MKTATLLLILASAISAGGISPKCHITDADAVRVYMDSSEFAAVMCSQGPGGTCSMAQWETWYDYMYQQQLAALSDGACGRLAQ